MHAQRSAKRAYGSGSIYEDHGAWYGRWRPAPGAPQLKRKLGPKRTRGGRDGQIESLIVELQRDGLRPKSVRNYVGTLATLLNFAVRKKWLASTPMTAVDLPALTSGDELDEPLRFLLPSEIHALADAALPGLYHEIDRALYLTAAFTGLRQGELRGLLWQHVDFDASRVRAFENLVRGTRTSPKSRRGRSVPMARTVAHALLVVRADSNWTRPHDPVFADPVTGRPIARTPMMRRYRGALTAAGLDPAFRFHDLRHTFGTSMARAGEPVTTIQAWLGHSDLKTTQRYMHYAPAADEAERVERAFAVTPELPGREVDCAS